jgi:hypothetical protein
MKTKYQCHYCRNLVESATWAKVQGCYICADCSKKSIGGREMTNRAGYKRDIDIVAEWLTDDNNVSDQGDYDTSMYRMADVIACDYSVSSLTVVNDIQGSINARDGR